MKRWHHGSVDQSKQKETATPYVANLTSGHHWGTVEQVRSAGTSRENSCQARHRCKANGGQSSISQCTKSLHRGRKKLFAHRRSPLWWIGNIKTHLDRHGFSIAHWIPVLHPSNTSLMLDRWGNTLGVASNSAGRILASESIFISNQQ